MSFTLLFHTLSIASQLDASNSTSSESFKLEICTVVLHGNVLNHLHRPYLSNDPLL